MHASSVRLTQKQQKERDAWRYIILMFRIFRAATDGRRRSISARRFCTLYREKEIALPDWVYETVRPFSVNTLGRKIQRHITRGPNGVIRRYGRLSNRKHYTHWDRHPAQKFYVELALLLKNPQPHSSEILGILSEIFPGKQIPSLRTIQRYVRRRKLEMEVYRARN